MAAAEDEAEEEEEDAPCMAASVELMATRADARALVGRRGTEERTERVCQLGFSECTSSGARGSLAGSTPSTSLSLHRATHPLLLPGLHLELASSAANFAFTRTRRRRSLQVETLSFLGKFREKT